jgi:hypothetical protein
VAHRIDHQFGVAYHPGHVGKIRDDLGWSVGWDERASGMRKRSAAGGAYAGPP